jgi:hypothetical protein
MNVRRVSWLRARRPSRPRLLATAVAILAVLALLATKPTWSAFSNTTTNPANTTTAGTVTLTDNDSGAAIFNLANLVPGDSDSGCLQVTYAGTLPALVRLYHTTTGSLATYLDLTITRGTISSGSFADCTNFTADTTNYLGQGAGVIYSGTLAAFGDDWASSTADRHTASATEAWTTNETHAYKLTLTAQDNNSAQGKSMTQTFTFEARNRDTGDLDQLAGTAGCVSETGTSGTCTDGYALDAAQGIEVSADGTSVYVASAVSDAVAICARVR